MPMPGAIKSAAATSTSIDGFTTRDGVHHPFYGLARVTGDAFIIGPEDGPPLYKAPVSEVVSVDVLVENSEGNQWVGGVLVVLAIVAVIFTVGAIVLASSKWTWSAHCPFLYSWDGHRYVLDGEPYAGATARALARTDDSELVHLVPVDGEYRVLLTNQQDETQHTDSLVLLAVDHFPGASIVLGQDGTVHAFHRRGRLTSATDQDGADVLPFLLDADQVSWMPDLDGAARQLPGGDTRNHLLLTFHRPKTDVPVYLVSNTATTSWGSLQARALLDVLGAEAQAFGETLGRNPAALQQYQDWNAREELFQLAVQVRVGQRWEKRGVLVASGPYVSENRAMPLDLSGVESDTVQLRIDPPVGFWRFNAFQLAWGESPTQVQALQARVARDETGRDVRAQLAADDGWTLDQPQAPNVTQLTFRAPPVPAGLTRTVFARTHGWYEVHLHDAHPPDVAALKRLQTEPGYAVRRALQAYAEFRRTGLLPGFPPPPSAGAHQDTVALRAP